jgi:serine/threonine-protein kinase
MTEPVSREQMALQEAVAGRYSIETEIGRGGMGIVFLARDAALNRPVAIKLLPPVLAALPDSRQRFLQEARTAAGLFHPNIVPIHAVEEQGDLVFYVMGYVQGETLRDLVERKGRLDPADVARIFQEVAWALAHAHERGVVHRDVKPDNILMERDSRRAMVTDFGIARSLDGSGGLTATGDLMGTPHYMSPEQATGERAGPESDIYSLGATVFFALTGRPPFEADNSRALLTMHLTQPAPPLHAVRADVPGTLAEVINRCLSKEPGERYPAGSHLADALNAARAGLQVTPPELVRYHDQADRTLIELAGKILLLLMLWLAPVRDSIAIFENLFRVGFATVAIGLSVFSLGSLLARTRELLLGGFAPLEILQSFSLRSRPEPGRWTTRLLAVTAGVLLVFWFWWLGGKEKVAMNFPEVMAYAILVVMVTVPIAIGRTLAGFLLDIRRTFNAWNRWWSRGLGRTVIALASAFLSRPRRVAGGRVTVHATEVVLGQSALAIYDALPPDARRALHDLPQVISRLEERAEALRRKEKELAEIQGQVGAAGGSASPLAASRRDAAEAIEAQRNHLGRQLASTIAAMENVRLDLLRLRAGVVSLESITANLEEARRVGTVVDALVELNVT